MSWYRTGGGSAGLPGQCLQQPQSLPRLLAAGLPAAAAWGNLAAAAWCNFSRLGTDERHMPQQLVQRLGPEEASLPQRLGPEEASLPLRLGPEEASVPLGGRHLDAGSIEGPKQHLRGGEGGGKGRGGRFGVGWM